MGASANRLHIAWIRPIRAFSDLLRENFLSRAWRASCRALFRRAHITL